MIAPKAGSQRSQILQALLDNPDRGITAYEAADVIGRSPNQAATRLLELREQGWVEHNGEERATTPGNTGLVHVLTVEGREQLGRVG